MRESQTLTARGKNRLIRKQAAIAAVDFTTTALSMEPDRRVFSFTRHPHLRLPIISEIKKLQWSVKQLPTGEFLLKAPE